jgi:FRG domain
METIGKQKIWSFFDGQQQSNVAKNADVRGDAGHLVRSYWDLATKIAELQFLNRDFVLLFRGQAADHRNKSGNTTLKPTLFRSLNSGNPNASTLIDRFETLRRAENALTEKYGEAEFLGRDRLRRHRILRWSILQHYEVCKTPLLDLTHSIRIAASFASLSANQSAFVYVLGVPNLSGAITASAEAGLQIVRLSSVCPPSALRPHIQEG